MTKLQNKNCTILINGLGFIESGQIDGKTWNKPSYLVLFRDYTRSDPLCRQWEMTTDIKNVSVGDDCIEYTKQVESVEIICRIEIQDRGWDWTVKINSECPLNHRFGVAVPWIFGNTLSLDKKITTPVSQYSTSLQQVYNDQSLLLLPILTRNDEKNHSIFGTMKQDHHFFTYDDSTTPYCRVTSSTTKTNTFSISYRVHDDAPSTMYVNLFPESENLICVWKPIFKQIGTKQGVEITCQHSDDIIERTGIQIRVCSPSYDQLERFSQYLKSALTKYPGNFIKNIGVSGILLSGKIIVQTKDTIRATGITFGWGDSSYRWIFLDVSQNDINVIHHEIFHYISKHIDMDILPDVSEKSKDEFYADLFAEMMLSPRKEDEKSSALHKSILSFCPDIHFAEQTINFDTQIWALRKDNREQIFFGGIPSDIAHCDFVSDVVWYDEWHANHPDI